MRIARLLGIQVNSDVISAISADSEIVLWALQSLTSSHDCYQRFATGCVLTENALVLIYLLF